jgi:glycosyltransferase involved in cell wall biosynthesis
VDREGKRLNELVSIITPSFNQGKYLAETMNSVLKQDYPNLEYLVIDGASNDNTVEVIHAFENKLAYWCSEPDRGQTDAINKGFAKAKGQILAWINSDDTYNPGAVRQAVEYLHDHPDVGMVYSDLHFIDEHSNVVGRFKIWLAYGEVMCIFLNQLLFLEPSSGGRLAHSTPVSFLPWTTIYG